MKHVPLLALLTLTLAACSQANTPTASGTGDAAALSGTSGVYVSTQAAYDALITADLKRLGAQALVTRAYLNVLPVPSSPDSVRAYVKTNYASPVITSISWGDGSANTAVSTPTVGRIETKDHAYATFGSYTVTLTSTDGSGVIVDTRTVTLQAGRRTADTVITFDAPPIPDGERVDYQVYSENGFSFQRSNYTVSRFSPTFGNSAFNLGNSVGLYMFLSAGMGSMTPTDGQPFTLKSLDMRDVVRTGTTTITFIGHKTDGSTVTRSAAETLDSSVHVTFDATWQNLTGVGFAATSWFDNAYFDNITVSR